MSCISRLLVTILALLVVATGHANFTVTEDTVCPPWMKYEEEMCTCLDAYTIKLQRNFLQTLSCETETQTTYVVSGTCITYSNTSSVQDIVVIGDCPYIPLRDPNYHYGFLKKLPQNVSDLDTVMCDSFNRQGMLCSSCKPGYGIAVYSLGYPCAKCDANHLSLFFYIILETIPITILYIIVIVFRLRATVPPLVGLVFFSNTVINTVRFRVSVHTSLTFSTTYSIRVAWKTFIFLSGIWNLDFFRGLVHPFCINDSLTNIDAVMLEYVSAFSPLVLVLITFIAIELHGYNVRPVVFLWKPFHRCFARFRKTWDIRYSIVNAFSTFLLLSYFKILTTSFRLLYQTSIYSVNETIISTGLHMDPTVQAFGSGVQSAISVTALFVIVVFSVAPLLLLLLYPTKPFQIMLRRCTCRAKHAIHLFVDTYQGCLKDGSNGTRDYRSVSALYLILRFSLLCIYIRDTEILRTGSSIIIFGLVFIVISIFMISLKPYKSDLANYGEFASFFFLGTTAIFLYIWLIFPHDKYIVIMIIIGLLPHCIIFLHMVYWVFKRYNRQAMLVWIKKHKNFVDTSDDRNNYDNDLTLTRIISNEETTMEEELPDRIINSENYLEELTD